MTAEIYGQDTGLGRGKGGHMHLFDPEHHFCCSGIIAERCPGVRRGAGVQARGHGPRRSRLLR